MCLPKPKNGSRIDLVAYLRGDTAHTWQLIGKMHQCRETRSEPAAATDLLTNRLGRERWRVFAPAFPGRNDTASISWLLSHQTASGW